MNKLPNLPINHQTACTSKFQAGVKPYTFVPVLGISTTVKSSLQISFFMQNKPNFRKAKMAVSAFITEDYENQGRLPAPGKQTQSNPISKTTKIQ
ncbi:MAG: hypothetical protein ACYS30_05480 [Planctomycetota bacterium]|jgi:hypothetical protein